MSRKNDYSKKILKKLGENRAIPVEILGSQEDPKNKYSVNRSLKNLVEAGFAELHDSEHQTYAKLTKEGKKRLNSILLSGEDALVNPNWDGFWRIVLLDLPENRKQERESLRYLLKKAGFVCLKNSVWISPLPYEYLFENIKKDLGLSTELMIFITDKIDETTKQIFLKSFLN
jgi:DNA-binding transcriptional regulator PaaX